MRRVLSGWVLKGKMVDDETGSSAQRLRREGEIFGQNPHDSKRIVQFLAFQGGGLVDKSFKVAE